MKNKIISFLLAFVLIFSATGFVFADVDLDNPPTKPQVENYQADDEEE